MVVVEGARDAAGGSVDEDAGTGIITLNRSDIFSYRCCPHALQVPQLIAHLVLLCMRSLILTVPWRICKVAAVGDPFTWLIFSNPRAEVGQAPILG